MFFFQMKHLKIPAILLHVDLTQIVEMEYALALKNIKEILILVVNQSVS